MRTLLLVIATSILSCVAATCHAQESMNTQATQAVTCCDKVPLVPCGLFGPSRREMMQRMLCQQQEANATMRSIDNGQREANRTLTEIRIEQARQTELLRQMAGSTQQAAQNSARAVDAQQDLRSHLLEQDIRSIPRIPGNAPADLRSLPDVPATVPDMRTTPRLQGNAPSDLRNLPDVPATVPDLPPRPILQGTNGRTYYARSASQTLSATSATTKKTQGGFQLR